MNTIKVKLLNDYAMLPRKNKEDSAYDLYVDDYVDINPGKTVALTTGIALEIPEGWGVQLYSRSGLASEGLFVVGGVIDSGYRGQIKVLLYNSTKDIYPFQLGDRIAQFKIHPVYEAQFVESDYLSTSERGEKGFGSSGR